MFLKRTLTLGLTCLSVLTLYSCKETKADVEYVSPTNTFTLRRTPKEITFQNDGQKAFSTSLNFNFVVSSDATSSDYQNVVDVVRALHIPYTFSKTIDKSKFNILAGSKSSMAGKIFKLNHDLSKSDSYSLKVSNGIFTVVGENKRSRHYGISTLSDIIKEAYYNTNCFYNLEIYDYPDVAKRGIIEGYYGVPWTTEDRINMFKYGSKYGYNSYVFAAKDDQYHSSKWRSLYPEELLSDMKKEVRAAIDYYVDYTWAIHPFMHDSIRFDSNYETDFNALTNKVDQLKSIGVSSFCLSADDIDIPKEITDLEVKDPKRVNFYKNLATNHAKVANDFLKHYTSNEQGISLSLVPTTYFTNSHNVKDYFDSLIKTLDPAIEIFWTGDQIMGEVTTKTVNQFKSITNGKSPYFWLNWPVNDFLPRQPLLAEGVCLHNDVESLNAIYSNPLPYIEATKVPFFQILDYAWNIKNYNSSQSYLNSFYSVDYKYGHELYLAFQHMQTYPEGSFWVTPMNSNESPYIKEELDAVAKMVEKGQDFISMSKLEVRKVIDPLIIKITHIQKAIRVCLSGINATMFIAELKPWLHALEDLTHATFSFLDICNRFVRNGKDPKNIGLIQKDFSLQEADNSLLYRINKACQNASITYKINVLNGWNGTYYAHVGLKTLANFRDRMVKALNEKIKTLLPESLA